MLDIATIEIDLSAFFLIAAGVVGCSSYLLLVAVDSISANVFVYLYRLGRTMHPERCPSHFFKRAAILSLAFSHGPELRRWWACVRENRILAMTLDRFPKMQRLLYRSYIHRGWSVGRRLELIDGHYRLLDGARAILKEAIGGGIVELASLEQSFPGLRVGITKMDWFHREGEIVILLRLRDEEIMSLAFTLSQEKENIVAYIGAIQGYKATEALSLYRAITHALHGLRPRDLIVVAAKILLREMGTSYLYAVANDSRHNLTYLSRSRVRAMDYDEIWLEHAGSRLATGFFQLPLEVKQKSASEIPTRKRALYRRRYRMLEMLETEIRSRCAIYAHSQEGASLR